MQRQWWWWWWWRQFSSSSVPITLDTSNCRTFKSTSEFEYSRNVCSSFSVSPTYMHRETHVAIDFIHNWWRRAAIIYRLIISFFFRNAQKMPISRSSIWGFDERYAVWNAMPVNRFIRNEKPLFFTWNETGTRSYRRVFHWYANRRWLPIVETRRGKNLNKQNFEYLCPTACSSGSYAVRTPLTISHLSFSFMWCLCGSRVGSSALYCSFSTEQR